MDRRSELGQIEVLLDIMARLRHPATGCPWDKQQTFRTIAPYTIEEAYEVADAIERDDRPALLDELGDLLFQVVFYARMAQEEGAFEFADIVAAISDKMLRRHPHVFGAAETASLEDQHQEWEAHKAAERAARATAEDRAPSALDGVADALPALMRAEKLQKRAARVGFDWPTSEPVFAKVEEELEEIRHAVESAAPASAVEEEIGDLIFACVNLARHLGVDAEVALRSGNRKFDRRFRAIEASLAARGKSPADSSLDEMDALWNETKRRESERKNR